MSKNIFVGVLFLVLNVPIQAQSGYAQDNFQKGEIELHLGDFKAAIQYYSTAIAAHQGYAEAYYSRGKAHLYLQKYQAAVDDFYTLTHLKPQYAPGYFYLGAIFYQVADYERAAKFLNDAIRLDSNYALAYNYRAEVHKELGLSTYALEDYSRAIRLAPRESVLYFGRGKCYVNFNRYTEAINDFNKAIILEPRQLIYYQHRLEANYLAQNYAATAQDFEYLSQNDSRNIPPHYYHLYALSQAQTQQYQAAVVAMEQVLRYYPSQAALYEERAEYYQKLKNYPLAIVDYQKAATLDTNRHKYSAKIIELYEMVGDWQQTITYLDALLQSNPQQSEFWYRRGLAYWQLNDKKRAKSDFNEALKLGFPKDKMDKKAAKMLKKTK
ncbi:MAG: tetratricopeptide repeat protein [Microscillaceae bacterium]|jgi:tetratricopeptide (TPR) repeat protein|nr:tetratricopeptide repeat protein [Microscillaceae bacterium]